MNLPHAIEQLSDVIRRQHLALATESTCVLCLRQRIPCFVEKRMLRCTSESQSQLTAVPPPDKSFVGRHRQAHVRIPSCFH